MRIYFPTWIDSLKGYAWAGGLGVVYTTDGGITWSIATDGVTIGVLGGLIHINITTDGVTVTDGVIGVLSIQGPQWREASQDLRAGMNIEYSYSLVDKGGIKATALVNGVVDGATTLTQLAANFTSLGGALDGVSGAQITGGTVRVKLPPDGGWKSTPDADSIVEQTATFNLGVAENTKRWGVNVPAIKDALLTANEAVDPTLDAVKTWVKLLDGTTALTAGNITNAAFQTATTAIDVVTGFRKHRKQLGRASFTIIPGADA